MGGKKEDNNIVYPLTEEEVEYIEHLLENAKSSKEQKVLRRLLEDRYILRNIIKLQEEKIVMLECDNLSLKSQIVCDQDDDLDGFYGGQD